MDTVVFTDSAVTRVFSTNMTLAKINTTVDTILPEQLGVVGNPMLVMLDASGQEIDRIYGLHDANYVLNTLHDYQRGVGTLDDLLSKVAVKPNRQHYYTIGEKFEIRNKPADAETWYRKVLADSPDDSLSMQARLGIGSVLQERDDNKGALEMFESVSKMAKDNATVADADARIAWVYQRSGDTVNAVKKYEEILKKHPDGPEARSAKRQLQRLRPEKTDSTAVTKP